jgi:hypothetical protein
MNRKNLKYWLLLLAGVGIVAAAELEAPKPLDWTATYASKDKRAYGSYAVYQLLNRIFPAQNVDVSRKTFYQLRENDSLTQQNFIIINDSFSPDSLETVSLLEMIQAGSAAFVAAEYFSGIFADTFKLASEKDFQLEAQPLSLSLVNPQLDTLKGHRYKKNLLTAYFSRFDSTKAVILGKNNHNNITFIQIPFGKGNLYLSTSPIAFTNYHLLNGGNDVYIAKALSYLPVQPVLWNENKRYKSSVVEEESQSPLRFLLSQPSLRWALYISLGAVLLFMIFEAKRRQRIIPIVKPLENTTLEFTDTVGGLYFQHKDHKNIADKKILYFFEYIRTRFFIRSQELDEKSAETLALKSGVSLEKIKTLFKQIQFIRRQGVIAETDLLELNKSMEAFYKIAGGKK